MHCAWYEMVCTLFTCFCQGDCKVWSRRLWRKSRQSSADPFDTHLFFSKFLFTSVCTNVEAHTHSPNFMRVFLSQEVCTFVYVPTCAYLSVCLSVCVYIAVYLHIYICICVCLQVDDYRNVRVCVQKCCVTHVKMFTRMCIGRRIHWYTHMLVHACEQARVRKHIHTLRHQTQDPVNSRKVYMFPGTFVVCFCVCAL